MCTGILVVVLAYYRIAENELVTTSCCNDNIKEMACAYNPDDRTKNKDRRVSVQKCAS